MAKISLVVEYTFEAPDSDLMSDILYYGNKKDGSPTMLSENRSIFDYNPEEKIISVNGKEVK